MDEPRPLPAARPPLAWPELLIGLGLLALAGLAAWQTATIPVSPMYAKVGPTFFPYLTAAGLGTLSLLLLLAALRGGWQPVEEKAIRVEWRGAAFVAAGLVANLLLIGPLGFTTASVALFVLVCHGFGSRAPVRDALIGVVLALAAYFGFARALGVDIGAGPLERLLGG